MTPASMKAGVMTFVAHYTLLTRCSPVLSGVSHVQSAVKFPHTKLRRSYWDLSPVDVVLAFATKTDKGRGGGKGPKEAEGWPAVDRLCREEPETRLGAGRAAVGRAGRGGPRLGHEETSRDVSLRAPTPPPHPSTLPLLLSVWRFTHTYRCKLE